MDCIKKEVNKLFVRVSRVQSRHLLGKTLSLLKPTSQHFVLLNGKLFSDKHRSRSLTKIFQQYLDPESVELLEYKMALPCIHHLSKGVRQPAVRFAKAATDKKEMKLTSSEIAQGLACNFQMGKPSLYTNSPGILQKSHDI
jgi:hypothetical protein